MRYVVHRTDREKDMKNVVHRMTRNRRMAAAILLTSGGLAPSVTSALPIEITNASFNFASEVESLPFGDNWAPVDTEILLTESASQISTLNIEPTLNLDLTSSTPISYFTIDSTISVELYAVLQFTTANAGETFGGTQGDTIAIEERFNAESVDEITVDLSGTAGDGLTPLELALLIINDGLALTEDKLTVTNTSSFSETLGFKLDLGESIGGDQAENDIIKASITGFTLAGVPLDPETLLNSVYDPDAPFNIPMVQVDGSIADASVDPPFGPFTLTSTTEPLQVPEPGTLALLGVALLPVLRRAV